MNEDRDYGKEDRDIFRAMAMNTLPLPSADKEDISTLSKKLRDLEWKLDNIDRKLDSILTKLARL